MNLNKTAMIGLGIILALGIITPSLAEDLTCTRSLPERYFSPGTITVTLSLSLPEERPNGLIIKELLPWGWVIDHSAPLFDRFDPAAGEVKWLVMGSLPPEMVLTYEVIVPPGFEMDETGISGKVLFIDAKRTQRQVDIGGDERILAE